MYLSIVLFIFFIDMFYFILAFLNLHSYAFPQRQQINNISNEVGKYLELKEKFLMRKRVNELTGTEVEKSLMYVDNYGEEDYASQDSRSIMDSEFKILGIDKEMNVNVMDEIDNYENINQADISEMNTPGEGFFVFKEEAAVVKENVRSLRPEVPKEVTMRFDDSFSTDNVIVKEVKEEKKEIKEVKEVKEVIKKEAKEEKNIQFKKEKLRFGFSQEEK